MTTNLREDALADHPMMPNHKRHPADGTKLAEQTGVIATTTASRATAETLARAITIHWLIHALHAF